MLDMEVERSISSSHRTFRLEDRKPGRCNGTNAAILTQHVSEEAV